MRYSVDEILYFRRVLFIKGWCFSSGSGPVKVSLSLPGGAVIRFGRASSPSPDVEKAWGEDASHCRFDSHAALPDSLIYTDLLHARLVFTASDGTTLTVEAPWRNPLRNDRFWDQRSIGAAVARHRGSELQTAHGLDPVIDSAELLRRAMRPLAGARVLEIGARARSGVIRRQLFDGADYVGFDIRPGENVDVVGDAHRLASYFKPESFDLVFSVSVFEHLAIPLQVVLQINRVLGPGGLVMVNTHQSWPVHDEPWDYHRFSEHTWAKLFNTDTGFELVEAVMGEPCYFIPATLAPHYQGLDRQRGFMATRCIAKKLGNPAFQLDLDPERNGGAPYSY